ncbi:MAG: hypothetical protein EAZ89_10160 [Bacteroidetes bacterium]|nr:MAG: hypothetical protein EAZ89_10160 [Bacteroidota bacterium]
MKRLSTLLSFSLLIFVALTLVSCDPAVRIAKKLEGNWDVTSYTEDGVEFMTVDINTFKIEFEEYADDEGDFSWTLIDTGGASIILDGTYEMKKDGDEMDITFKSGALNGTSSTLDVDLNEDELGLSGNINGFLIKIEADRD